MISANQQDQKLDFYTKVFNRSADKKHNSGLKVLLTKGEPVLMAPMPSLS